MTTEQLLTALMQQLARVQTEYRLDDEDLATHKRSNEHFVTYFEGRRNAYLSIIIQVSECIAKLTCITDIPREIKEEILGRLTIMQETLITPREHLPGR